MREALLIPIVALALAGCGSDDGSGTSSAATTLPSLRTTAVPTTTTAVPTTTASAAAPPSADVTTASRSAITADQVVKAFLRANLPADSRVDNTAKLCPNWGCVQLITAETLSVYQFDDVDKATKLASTFPLAYQRDLIVVRFQRDGQHAIDQSLIPQYQAVLDSLVDG